MTQISIAEAARLVGKDRKAIYRAINSGTLSVTVSATSGTKQVDVSELERVFGQLSQEMPRGEHVALPHNDTLKATEKMVHQAARIAALEAELAGKNELLAERQARIDDLRQSLLLLDHKAEPVTLPPHRPWWRWFSK